MIFKLKCECGHISKINTDKCDKYICTKCGVIIFEKTEDYAKSKKG